MEGSDFKRRSGRQKKKPNATPLVRLIRYSDFLLEIADARYPELSRNKRLEARIRLEGRRLVVVFNKADLISMSAVNRLQERYKDSFVVSSKTRQGFADLRFFLKHIAPKREVTIGVIGFPNTGKSSVINILKGKHAAGTSPSAGFTKSMQKLRISPRVLIWDTPGIAPFGTNDILLATLGAKNPEFLKDAEGVALHLIQTLKIDNEGMLAKRYKIDESIDNNAILEAIALKIGALSKGGIPDTERAARTVINDWQRSKLVE